MSLDITKKDVLFIFAGGAAVLVVAIPGWSLVGEWAVVPLFALSVAVVLFAQFEIYRRLAGQLRRATKKQEHQRHQDYRQVEALFSLFWTLQPSMPIPEMRGWAASPDLLRRIVDVILREKPNLVVEASSGISTLIIAYCLKKLGRGRVISFDHEEKFAGITRELISSHGLADVASVIHAPLTTVELNNRSFLWYDPARFVFTEPIDVLVIDGPPGALQELSRYPALPVLYRRLNATATILLDDGLRPDEQKAVALWQREFGDLTSESLDTEKGAYLLRKRSTDSVLPAR